MVSSPFPLDVRRDLLGQVLLDPTGRRAGYVADVELDAVDDPAAAPSVTALLSEPTGATLPGPRASARQDPLADVLTGQPARIDLDLVRRLDPPVLLHVPAAELCPMPLGERVRDRLVLRVPLARQLIGATVVDEARRPLGGVVDARLDLEPPTGPGGLARVRLVALLVIPSSRARPEPGHGPVVLPWRGATWLDDGRIVTDPASLGELSR